MWRTSNGEWSAFFHQLDTNLFDVDSVRGRFYPRGVSDSRDPIFRAIGGVTDAAYVDDANIADHSIERDVAHSAHHDIRGIIS